MRVVDGMESTRPCFCGKVMILENVGFVLPTHPPQVPTRWHCYGCHQTLKGPTLVERNTSDEERWKLANRDRLLAEQLKSETVKYRYRVTAVYGTGFGSLKVGDVLQYDRHMGEKKYEEIVRFSTGEHMGGFDIEFMNTLPAEQPHLGGES
jgi:hypothetical protein